jgi:hypothetical protein
MSEILSSVGELLPHVKTIALVVGVTLGVIALAAAMYVLQTAFGPLWRVVQWLFGYTPGQRPGDIVAGMIYGFRMLAWAGVIGFVVWFFAH